METVGHYLKCEREAKNMSLRDASRLTCIAEYYLGYIEKDEFDKLPQGPYIKGYITSYSEMIGTDVNKALDLYESLGMQCDKTGTFRGEESLPQDGAVPPPIKSGIKVFDTPPPETSTTTVPHDASEVPAPVASPFKRTAITARRKCAVAVDKGAGYVMSSLSTGKGWLDRVKLKAPAASSLKAPAIAVWRKCAAGAEKGAGYVTSSLPIGKRWLDAAVARIKARRWGRLWRPLLLTIVSACILVLAAFGFYHLFIYEEPSLTAIDRQLSPMPAKASSLATETEKSPVNVKTTDPAIHDTQQPDNSAAMAAPGAGGKVMNEGSSAAITSPTNANDREAVGDTPPTSTEAAATPGVAVLKASVCSGIKDRMPSGVDNVFSHSDERIYVWTQVQATVVPNQIRHVYYFNDQAVSNVALKVGSAHWRTWSYLSNLGNRGDWRVDVTSADGKVLRRLYFTVE